MQKMFKSERRHFAHHYRKASSGSSNGVRNCKNGTELKILIEFMSYLSDGRFFFSLPISLQLGETYRRRSDQWATESELEFFTG
jgi:hypothetical protein